MGVVTDWPRDTHSLLSPELEEHALPSGVRLFGGAASLATAALTFCVRAVVVQLRVL